MRLLAPIVASALVALLVPGAAAADPFPGRRGASGILDVPDAETIGRGGGLVGGELRLDKLSGVTAEAGPLPLSIVTGLSQRLDVGFFMREWGYPGDPRPSPLLMGAALKLQLFAPELFRPGLALELTSDRFNWKGNGGAQLTSSTGQLGPVRLAAFVGVDGHGPRPYSTALTAGLGATVAIVPRLDTALEAVKTADGPIVGAALRYRLTPRAGVSLGVSWLPDQSGVRVSLGFGAVAVSPAPKPTRVPVAEAPVEEAPAAEEAPAGPLLVEDRPHFRLKIHLSDPSALGEPRHLQHAPYAPPALSAAPPRLPGPTKAAAPSADDVLEAQVKDQETQAEARLKRLRASDEALADRDAAAQADARRLEAQAQQLAGREQQLDAREKRIVLRGAPTQAQRQLESQEAQLAAAERQLAATERGFAPTLEAAHGTERDASAREQVERSEKERLEALVGLEKVKSRQLDLRRQGVAAKQRMLAAMEGRLVAKGDRIDAVEKQLRTRGERLDTWQRRLEARAERLDLMEKRAAEQQRPAETVEPSRAAAQAAQAAKDKSVFVMVVKSPTAIMKEQAGKAAGPGEVREAVHPGVAVEKAVAAATVVSFASPSSRLSELDRESIDAVARLAAREGTELLIWARAKDPSLMSEAIRRSEEIKGYVVNTASLSPKQVVTRITTRPGAQGVDVVVSALRDSGKALQPAPAAPVTPAPGAPNGSTPARPADRLLSGETSRRQIRDAVVSVQPSIERCVGEQMVRRGLTRAEGTLKLTVNPQGRVVGTSAGGGPLGGPEMEECLRAASAAWLFPPAETEYVVDIPITIVAGGANR